MSMGNRPGRRKRTRGEGTGDLWELKAVVASAFESTAALDSEIPPSERTKPVDVATGANVESRGSDFKGPAEEGSSEGDPVSGMPELKSVPLPEVLPARMLNEYVYCPRLFYYEHVEGIFVENADTKRGASVHKRVDAGSGALAAPGEDGRAEESIHSRSVSLGSDRLAVTAKLDLVESATGEDGLVCPVEYKAGSPREGDAGVEIWPADRMQLGLQMLLLRENGYRCEQGVIYYRGTKQRVTMEFTPELETWVLQQIQDARNIAVGPIPPPLVNSPKCVRCSLNSVCLPDETLHLQHARISDLKTRIAGRRLMAAREDTRVLYLNTPGVHIGLKNELLTVKEEKRLLEEIRINDLTHVSLFGNIQISTQAIQKLCEHDVPVTYFSMGGWFYGITRGHGLKNIFTRIEQFRCAADPAFCLGVARQFIHGKIRNQRTLLMRLHGEPPAPAIAKLKSLANSALEVGSLAELLGTEGAAAAVYFGEFNGMLKADDGIDMGAGVPPPEFRFEFSGRNRRPPTDPVNALLSLAYSLLAKECTLAAVAVGFDPYAGFYHQPRFGRPALALDLMEEFRPLIAESAVLTCINNGMIQGHHFVRAGRAVNLTADGRKIFFNVFEQRMNSLITHPIFDYKVSYRRVIELQLRLLARFVTGEIPDYPPFLTR